MSGHKNWAEIRAETTRDPLRQARVDEMKRAANAAYLLAQLREQRAVRQVDLASAMGTTQGNISRIEHQEDLFISTLREYVEALGGRLEVRAVFDDESIPIEAAPAQA